MESKGVIILGSSRSLGNTNTVSRYVSKKTGFEFIDLNNKKIGQFDYEFTNSGDDFLPLMREIVKKYETIVFATPVYWYSMSGTMKAFFDRISDLLKTERDLGRKLRGKNMAMISCGSDRILQQGFTMPFMESAKYLGMKYLGDVHTWIENESTPEAVTEKLDNFIEKLKYNGYSNSAAALFTTQRSFPLVGLTV